MLNTYFITNYLLHVYHQLPPTCLSPVTSYMFITSYLLHVSVFVTPSFYIVVSCLVCTVVVVLSVLLPSYV
jgi:hypothetical protein